MGHHGGDRADARFALPPGWVEVDPTDAAGYVGGRIVQLATVEDWDGSGGVRPTMSVSITPSTSEHIAARVLAGAQASLEDVHVVSIDDWTAPATPAGRRLVFAHVDGDATLTTLVWVASTTVGEVVVTAHVESIDLHLHDRTFAEAAAGIRLPSAPAESEPPADLVRRAHAAPWSDVVPASDGGIPIVPDPDARILVEASVGAAKLRFDATLARDHATVAATASPRALAPRLGQSAGTEAVPDTTATFRVPATRLALAVARWLGLGPAWTAANDPVTVPISLVMSRLVDPTVPAPAGVDATTWQQPWFLWTLRSSATDSGLVMVDTGVSGQCAVMETDDEDTTRFAPLTSYNVWLTLNWLISESLRR